LGADFRAEPADEAGRLGLHFEYGDERYFRWDRDADGKIAHIEARLGRGAESLATRVKPLAPEQEIAEALFF